ncbi:Bloom syndrome protein -like protein, partial [Caligus rogercresseyi]
HLCPYAHGGGKEFLPSVTNRVLSLLASIIYDKLTKLDGLGIPADHIIGEDYGRKLKISEKLCLLTPQITLFYMIPEK